MVLTWVTASSSSHPHRSRRPLSPQRVLFRTKPPRIPRFSIHPTHKTNLPLTSTISTTAPLRLLPSNPQSFSSNETTLSRHFAPLLLSLHGPLHPRPQMGVMGDLSPFLRQLQTLLLRRHSQQQLPILPLLLLMQGKVLEGQQRTRFIQQIGSMDQSPHSSFTSTSSHPSSVFKSTFHPPPATVRPLHQPITQQSASCPPGCYRNIEDGNQSSDRP
jgi:hypothetical protein